MKSLVFEIDARDAERLGDCLIDCGALSVASEDALTGTAREAPLFDEPGENGAWKRVRMQVLCAEDTDERELLGRTCAAIGIVPPSHVAVEPVADEDWVRRSRAQFEPIQASGRIWIVPSWCTAPDPEAINIVLDPGLAFGTGSHATTRLCLRWLDRTIRGGETVLDYGCGSGILALAALKLGAAHSTGVDIDPQALAAARENAARNRLACEFFPASLPIEQKADIVIANILANPLKVLAPLIAAHTRLGGQIALSGILESQAEEMVHGYERWFEFGPQSSEEGWMLLSARRNQVAC